MQYYAMQLSAPQVAGDTLFFDAAGSMVRYDEETSGAAANKIQFATDTGDSFVLKPGQAAILSRQFGRLTLANKSGLNNLLGTIAIGGGDRVTILDSNFTGTVSGAISIVSTTGDANTAKTVTNASAQLMAANTARKYLAIQNKDAAGTVWVNFGAGAATQANGFMLGPGESYEREVAVSTLAIQAIGDAASNGNVVVIEA